MKTITYSIFLIFTFILFQNTSCVKPPAHSQAYYNFRGDDLDKLLDFEMGQQVSYQSNFGEILTYTVATVTDDYKKQQITGGGAFLGIPIPISYHFYYDLKQIKFTVNQNIYEIEYDFMRYPVDEDQAINHSYSELKSEFIGQIFFVNWNGTEVWNGSNALYSFNGIRIDYGKTTSIMDINGTVYNNVLVLASGNPNPLINGVIVRKVNRIYYDKYHGVIGFDETDGKQWRIMN